MSAGLQSRDPSAGTEATGISPQPPQTPPPTTTQGSVGRKKGTSCARCRRQKIRCDDNVPSCGNCTRAGQVCIRTHFGNNPDVIRYETNHGRLCHKWLYCADTTAYYTAILTMPRHVCGFLRIPYVAWPPTSSQSCQLSIRINL